MKLLLLLPFRLMLGRHKRFPEAFQTQKLFDSKVVSLLILTWHSPKILESSSLN